VAGKALVAADDVARGQAHFRRSARIFSSIGQLSARRQVLQDAAACGALPPSLVARDNPPWPRLEPDALAALRSEPASEDSARFAARQNFSNYTGCSGAPGGTVASDAQTIAQKGTLDSTAADLLPNWGSATFSVDVTCADSVDGQDMLGIYRSRFGGTCDGSTANGCAQVVTVSATIPYRSILGSFGFTGLGLDLNASSQAAVTGI
jgi:hypothetical protein